MWQVAQLIVPSPESLRSKKSIFPSSIFSSVPGFERGCVRPLKGSRCPPTAEEEVKKTTRRDSDRMTGSALLARTLKLLLDDLLQV
jgi:hypothetical protein